MKIILLKDISGLGKKYDVKDVKSGYALNYMIPRGEAVQATRDVMKRYDMLRAKIQGERVLHEQLTIKTLRDLDGKVITVIGKANDKGHLFAGIHKKEVVGELHKQTHQSIGEESVLMDQPIKEIGEHQVEISAQGKVVKVKINVIAGK